MYGERILKAMADRLGIHGLSETNLKCCRRFYDRYGRIRQTVSDEFHKLLPGKEVDANAALAELKSQAVSDEVGKETNVWECSSFTNLSPRQRVRPLY